MPIAVHLCLHYLLGAWAAWSARYVHALHARLIAWPLGVVTALAALLLVPCTTYQFRFYPDHALGYAVDPVLYPQVVANIGPLSALAEVGYLVALLAGYAAMRHGLCNRHRLRLLIPVVVVATLGIAVVVQLGGRAWHFGSYGDFWAGSALPWTNCVGAQVTAATYVLSALASARLSRLKLH